jgi:hypothetical protein
MFKHSQSAVAAVRTNDGAVEAGRDAGCCAASSHPAWPARWFEHLAGFIGQRATPIWQDRILNADEPGCEFRGHFALILRDKAHGCGGRAVLSFTFAPARQAVPGLLLAQHTAPVQRSAGGRRVRVRSVVVS